MKATETKHYKTDLVLYVLPVITEVAERKEFL